MPADGETKPMRDYFLADDLSGALDAAAGFHAAGRRVRMVWTMAAWDAAPVDAVVGYTTETRNASAPAAAATVTEILEHGKRRGARLCYKKIDSTLRGQVAAELQAVLAALPEARVLITPANPRVGRTVVNGVLLVNGVPVSATEFGRDPASPVRESSIPALLRVTPGGRIEIADVVAEGDLVAAVARMQSTGGEWIAVGSGALARPVAAARLGMSTTEDSVASRGAATARRDASGARLMICGSAHPANREQALLLSRERGVAMVDVSVTDPLPAAARAVEALRTQGGAALLLAAERTIPEQALQAITTVAAQAIAARHVDRFFVTGGETAFALCRRLGSSCLDFVEELEPGLCLARADSSGGPRLLAVKPGGFGDARTWIRAWDALA